MTPTAVLVGANGIDAGGNPLTNRLFIISYRGINDTRGLAPTVALIAPGTGISAKGSRLLAIKAKAADDVAVAAVVFSVNGVDVFTDSIAPYEFDYLVPAGATSITVGVRAVDFAGTSSGVVTMAVPVSP